MADTELTYEEVLEYLADREGEEVTLSSYPTFSSRGNGGQTLLGLSIAAEVGAIKPIELAFADFVNGQAAVRIEVFGYDGGFDNGLVLTREWFGGAMLADRASRLDIIVRADLSAEPLHPPVGQERDPDEKREVGLHELVGWAFAFDFDGSPPLKGRWADGEES